MEEAGPICGFKVWLTNLRYAVDLVLFATSLHDLIYIYIWAADSFIVLSPCGNCWIRFLISFGFGSKTISFCEVSGAVCIKPPIANTTWLCNGFPSLVSAWLRMTFVFHVLNVTASHSQNLHNVRQRNCAAPMAHDPLINTLGLGNRLDFNRKVGGRCHLLPSVANRVEAPSLKRCLLREQKETMSSRLLEKSKAQDGTGAPEKKKQMKDTNLEVWRWTLRATPRLPLRRKHPEKQHLCVQAFQTLPLVSQERYAF